jgi:hypothetical protein
MKRTSMLLSIGAMLSLSIGFVLLHKPLQCVDNRQCLVDPVIPFGRLLFEIGLAIAAIAWLFGLITTARLGRWGWLIEVFLLGPLGALIYGIAGPTTSHTA